MENINMPIGLLGDKNIPTATRTIYAYINTEAQNKGYVQFTDSHFADLFGMNAKTVRRHINELVDKGYLKKEVANQGFQRIRKLYPLKQF